MAAATAREGWQPSACILCSLNCGIEIEVVEGRFRRIRGDRRHPVSAGYTCQKALCLDHYQNDRSRLRQPLRRRADGSFEPVSWETAIGEIAERLRTLRDEYGGHSFAYYGGGGQGNHLGGAHGGKALRAALGSPYVYTSLAQEKTGGFWVDGRLFGKQTCHPTEDAEHADFLLVIGANPWQSHGIQQARKVIQDIARDPARTLVVVDPRRSETAAKADVHLQVRPGTDAHLLLAMLGTIVQEGLENRDFLQQRTVGHEQLCDLLRGVDIEQHACRAGVSAATLRRVATQYATAERACLRTDLGLEHTLHSTLNTYLSKLLYLVTGHFGRPGCNVFHTQFGPMIGHSRDPDRSGRTTRVTGAREIGGIYPPNVLPREIDTDHPERIRALWVDSHNPLISGADTAAFRQAFAKLDLLVVLDVAMTETARVAHYVLPACSQFEKWEASFFNFEFPGNFFHLRRPIVEPQGDLLPEPEIYRRLLVALGELPPRFPELEAIAKEDRLDPAAGRLATAIAQLLLEHPQWQPYLPIILHETLGAALPGDARPAAAIWGLCQVFIQRYGPECVERAGIKDNGAGLAEALFEKILSSPSGVIISVSEYDDTWNFIKHRDGKIHLLIPELLAEITALDQPAIDEQFPLLAIGGERRSYNANSILRGERWRKDDQDGRLKIHPADGERFHLEDGQWAICQSRRGQVDVRVQFTDEVMPGVVSLPNGFGMEEDTGDGATRVAGPALNQLTWSDHCDAIAKTPLHKYLPVRLEPKSMPASPRSLRHATV